MGPKKPPKNQGTPKIRAFKFVKAQTPPPQEPVESEDESPTGTTRRRERTTRRIITAAVAAKASAQKQSVSSSETTPQIEPATINSDIEDTSPELTQPPPSKKVKKQAKDKPAVTVKKSTDAKPAKTNKATQQSSAKTIPKKVKATTTSQTKIAASAPKKSKSGKALVTKASVSNQAFEEEENVPSPTPPQDEVDDFASDDQANDGLPCDNQDVQQVLREEVEAPESPIKFGKRRKWITRKFSQEQDARIIEFVKENPIFYNKSTPVDETPTRDELLLEIEREMKIPGQELWHRFTNLRTTWARTRKEKSGQAAPKKTACQEWLDKQMEFIRIHSKPVPLRARGGLDIQDDDVDEDGTSPETDADESSPGRGKRSRGRKKKKFNTEKIIKSLLADKARDQTISKKIQNVLDGVDEASSAKMTFGNWIATQMPRINDKRFMRYATNIQNYTFNQIILSEADAAQNTTPPPTQPPATPGTPAPSSSYADPVSHHTPPNVAPSQQQAPMMMHQTPSFQSVRNVPPHPGTFQQQGMMMQGQQQYGVSQGVNLPQPAVYGPNRQLQPTQQLQSGQIAPHFLPSDLSNTQSSGNVSQDPDGRTFQEMQPAELSYVQPLPAPTWETPGPVGPRAVPQPSPSRGINASVSALIKHGRAQNAERKKIKQEKVDEPQSTDSDYQIDEGDASET